jgi:hypothetical protein
MLQLPRGADPFTVRLVRLLNEELLRREPMVLGFRQDATKVYVRYRAPLSAPWVQVHVQSTQAGEGGTTAYDASNYTSTTEVDCRAARVQDVEVVFVAASTYAVFLIPVQYDGAGTKVLYNGVGGLPDNMSCVGFVV